MRNLDQTGLLLLYQKLDDLGEKLEKKEYSEEVQLLLEQIGERQVEILNLITIQ